MKSLGFSLGFRASFCYVINTLHINYNAMKVSDIFSLLTESKELLTVYARPMNKLEEKIAKEYQALSVIIHDHLKGPKSKETWTEQHVKELVTELKKFKRFKFLKWAIEELDDAISAFGKMKASQENMKKHRGTMNKHSDAILAAMEAGDIDKVHDISTALGAILDEIDAHVDVDKTAKHQMKKSFTRENFWLFNGGSTEIFDSVDGSMYEKVAGLDFNKPLYTYTNMPLAMLESDWRYILAFMLELSETDKPKRIKDTHEFRRYLMLHKAGSDSYKTLMNLLDNYLHSNNKELIPKIMEYIENHPEIRDRNNKEKKKIKYVFRGIPGYREEDGPRLTQSRAILNDKKQKFVATSASRHAAKNFALGKGHLESERRSEFGYLIEYEVNPESIILATYILGTAYGESEILIDASKAKVKQVEEV